MKTSMLVTSLLLASGLAAFAQPGGGGMGGGMGGGFGGGRGRGGILTEEQQTKVTDAVQAQQTERNTLNEKLNAAQADAVKAALAKDAKEADVRAKVEAVVKVQTDLAMLQYKAVKGVTFTDEQKTQLTETPAMGYTTLFGGAGGRGRMGGMGMGGPGGGMGGPGGGAPRRGGGGGGGN